MDWTLLAVSAFAVLGTMEWVKGFFKKTPSWVWRVAMPFACVGIMVAPEWVRLSLAVLSLTQIGYEAFVVFIQERIGMGKK